MIERQRGSYRCKFPCAECRKEAQETITTVKTGTGIENKRWVFRWSGKCGHVTGEKELVVAVGVPVEENGVEVGVTEAVAPPEWPRYEVSRKGQTNYDLPCAWFGTLWQAEHASLQDSRLLAQVQKLSEPSKSNLWEATPKRPEVQQRAG